ncbi:MAG: ABC transporter permease [Acidobacteriota bacterium]
MNEGSLAMLSNYLKIAWRNTLRDRGYSLINIIGLALGMAACGLVFLYVREEIRFDHFHERAGRIYRVAMTCTTREDTRQRAETQFPLVHALRADYPEVERATRLFFPGTSLIEAGGQSFNEESIVFTDSDLFRIFSFPVLRGRTSDLLAEPDSIVLTETAARKYFPDGDAVGKMVRFDERFVFRVTAVIKDVPRLSHFHFDFAAPFAALDKDFFGGFTPDTVWGGVMSNYTYCLLVDGSQAASLEATLRDVVANHLRSKDPGVLWSAFLQPLASLHLHSHLEGEREPPGSPAALAALALIGAFILLIAVINFVNLTTVRAVRRHREIGLRKVIGARREQLLAQFMGEALCVSAAALVLSAAVIAAALPGFSELVGRPVAAWSERPLELAGFLIVLTLLVGLLAGSYPAFLLAGRSPTSALKRQLAGSAGPMHGGLLRRTLVVAQFGIAATLIICTLVVHRQLQYFGTAPMGFNREAVVSIAVRDQALAPRLETLKAELLKLSGVQAASACLRPPISNGGVVTGLYRGEGESDRIDVTMNFIDCSFVDQFGIRLLCGRNVQPLPDPDADLDLLLNETCVRRMGLSRPQEALGRKLRTGVRRRSGTVVGVMADFHSRSLKEGMASVVMAHWPHFFSRMAVTLRPESIRSTMGEIEHIWRSFSSYPFEATFLDDDIRDMYTEEQKTLSIAGTFAGLAIGLACLGLLGLAAYTTQQRTKEIGVRKVLGASVGSIIRMLYGDLGRCILIALMIATPTACFVMSRWLRDFPYHAGIGAAPILCACLAVAMIAMSTVGVLSVRAACANPVDALRHE